MRLASFRIHNYASESDSSKPADGSGNSPDSRIDPAIQAFHIFRVGILGDELRAGMAASSGISHNLTPKLNES